MYPGMNKVLQAVGRVIRSEEDRGIVLLIDDRFFLSSYKKLFPEEWKKVHYVANPDNIRETIESFWAGS
jgi:DNA excision repair protein ERCC-2